MPPSMGFSRQEYWGWVPLPSPTAILGIHKNENEAHTFTAYETRFHIAKITPFPFVSLKSIYLTCAPDKRNRIHSGHIGSFSFIFLF